MTIPDHIKNAITERIQHLPGQILFGLARNPSANYYWRKAAVELLIDNNCREAKDPELVSLVIDVQNERKAKAEVQSIVETAIEEPLEPVVEFHADKVPATLPEHSGETLVVVPLVPVEIPTAPVDRHENDLSALKASVTTASLTQDEVIEN